MTPLRHTNSWHWLLMAMAICLPIGVCGCFRVWKKALTENGPILQGMTDHANELKLLREEDALRIEQQVREIERQIAAYEAAVSGQGGQPVPSGEQSVLVLINEINRALLRHQIRVIEQEQVPPNGTPKLETAKAAATTSREQNPGSLPYATREIRCVTEGEYKDMFMFLIRQSHLKPSYHFKAIRISPSPGPAGVRMEFTVQIHFT